MQRLESQTDLQKHAPNKKRRAIKIIAAVSVVTVVAAVAIGVIFGYAVPLIVQGRVDGSSLTFTAVTITNPKNESFTVQAMGILANAGPDTAYMQPTGVSVYYAGNLLGTMQLPATTINGGQDTPLDITSDFKITDRAIFDQFSKDLVSKPAVTWHLSATPDVKALGITFKSIRFEKDVVIAGLNGLPNVTVTKFQVQSPNPTSVQIISQATIINPSTVSMLPIGDLYMDLYYKGTKMANVFSPNVSLATGKNVIDITGFVIPGTDTNVLSELFSTYLGTTTSPLTSQTTASSIPLYTNALKSLALNINLLGGNFTLITGIQVQNLALDFTSGPVPTMTSTIRSGLYIPFQIPINITHTQMTFSLQYMGTPISSVLVPLTPATNDPKAGTLSLSFANSSLTVLDSTIFSQFATDLMGMNQVSVLLSGMATALVTTPLGVLTLSSLPFSSVVPLNGLNGFGTTNPITINSVDVLAGSSGKLTLGLGITVPNPSSVEMNVGTTTMDIYYLGTYMGSTSLSLNLKYGNNSFNVKANYIQPGAFNASTGEVGRTFLSRHLTGFPNQVTLKGSQNATGVPLLQQALRSLQTKAVVPGLQTKLIQSSTIMINVLQFQIDVKTLTNNPFTAGIALECLNFAVYNNGTGLLTGNINNFCFNPPFAIAGKSSATTSAIPLANIQSLIIPNSVALIGTMSFFVPDANGFHQYVDFFANNVPAALG